MVIVMSKRSRGTNRVCFNCRKKFQGKFSNDVKRFTLTDNCGKCDGNLHEIPDSLLVPKSSKRREWKKLEQDYLQQNLHLKTPASAVNLKHRHQSLYPEHREVDRKLNIKSCNSNARENYLRSKKEYPQLTEALLAVANNTPYSDLSVATEDLQLLQNEYPTVSNEEFLRLQRIVSRFLLVERDKERQPSQHPSPFSNPKYNQNTVG